jgi:hypothetical protein
MILSREHKSDMVVIKFNAYWLLEYLIYAYLWKDRILSHIYSP